LWASPRAGRFALLTVAILALWLRVDALEWDDRSHPHPDERFNTMVASQLHQGRLSLSGQPDADRQERLERCRARNGGAEGIGGWFDTECSDLNPANVGHPGYPYGQLPLTAVRLLAELAVGLGASSDLPGYGRVVLVGRLFSAACDLLALLATFLIGRLLWSRGVGGLAAALYATAVLPIQSAHFWTVDTSATLFATLSLLFLVRLTRFGRRGDAFAFGVAFGLALSCKISVAPMLALLPLAAYWAPGVNYRPRPDPLTRLAMRAPEMALAIVGAFLSFRMASPYAFVGPEWSDLWPAKAFFDQVAESRRLASGAVDFPPNWQWLGRTPWLDPARNLVLWGLGPALGISALAGMAVCGVRLLRATPIARARAVAWLWAVGYFLWMGQQWASSMRYLLPIYPALCVFAAGLLVPWWRRRRAAAVRAGSGAGSAPAVVILTVLLLSAAWALAFHQIHRSLHPYVAATHWILRNVEAPLSARVETLGPDEPLINWPAGGALGDDFQPRRIASTRAPADGVIDALRLHRASLIRAAPAPTLSVSLLDAQGRVIGGTGEVVLPFATDAPAGALIEGVELTLNARVALKGGETYSLRMDVQGGSVKLAGAGIVQEGPWNDPVPMSVLWLPATDRFDLAGPSGTAPRDAEGVDPFGQGYYRSLNLEMATEDDGAKRRRLLDCLDDGEWLVVPNNRFYDSMTRNPLRFPLATRFYDALFAGELGYSPALVVASPPRIAGLTIPDQALPSFGQRLRDRPGTAWMPEEAFSVYDHPAVLVFRKDATYTPAITASVFDDLELTDVRSALHEEKPATAGRLTWSTAEASMAPDGLLRETRTRPDPRRPDLEDKPVSGTGQLLAVLEWYGISLALGILAWPWLATLWPHLPDRGYGAARIAGITAVALPAWWLARLHLPAWTPEGLATTLVLFTVATVLFLWYRRREGIPVGRSAVRAALVGEAAFVALFVIGLMLRLANPDLWAPSLGGEKPMDFALFNRVLSTDAFPPGDPWFGGGRVNYYYFGWVLAGVLAHLSATPAALAYNLAVPTWFALTGIASASLTFNIVALARRTPGGSSLAWRAAAIALCASVLLGNLDLPRGVSPTVTAVLETLDGNAAVNATALEDALARHSERWFWAPTRTVGERPGSSHEINEFPAFTFLFGDLHPHALALPLQLLALFALLGLAAAEVMSSTGTATSPRGVFFLRVVAVALPVGLLRATNTWDWPLYLTMACAATAVTAWLRAARSAGASPPRGPLASPVLAAGAAILLVVTVQWMVGWPFHHFVTGNVAPQLFEGSRTPLPAWFAMQGWFLIAIGGWSLVLSRRPAPIPRPDTPSARALSLLRWTRWSGISVTLIALGAALYSGGGDVPALGMQIALLAWLMEVLWRHSDSLDERAGLVLALVGFGLAVVVELVVLGGDLGRMNTFFKLHMQAWVLLSIAAGIAAGNMLGGAFPGRLQALWRTAFATATFVACAYLPLGTYGRSQTRFDPGAAATLDGEAYMAYAVYDFRGERLRLADDARIIRWLRQNAGNDDLVLEAQLPEYQWGSRISTYSGRPTLLGYRYHQTQQRPTPALGEAIELRRQNIAAIYATTDADRKISALRHYGVRFVVVGGLERAIYPAEGLALFEDLAAQGALEVVLSAADDRIFRVRDTSETRHAPGPSW